MRERWTKNELPGILNNHLVDYPTPANINYAYGFGALSGICLGIQIVSGIIISMHYQPTPELAPLSLEYIQRRVQNGWLIRHIHINGASLFFICVYIHIFRGIYYGSYRSPRRALWVSGVIILFLMMGIGFLGYVLPWGQMSYWGATVITSMVTAVPYIGNELLEYALEGYGIDGRTLKRFFILHYALPFLLAGLAIGHIIILHVEGSTSPLGVEAKGDRIGFYPYCYVKDLFVFMVFVLVFSILVLYKPFILVDPLTYSMIDEMKTPKHIVPEWYFLPFYTMLRAIDAKVSGILLMLGGVAIIGVLPFISVGEVRTGEFRPLYERIFWFFVCDCVVLGWIGTKEAEIEQYKDVGRVATIVYYVLLLIVLPGVGKIEQKLARWKEE